MHTWGDGFDFDRLNEAGSKIAKIYNILTGHNMIWKEKYGTLRFEMEGLWIKTNSNYRDFITSVMLVLPEYPDLIKEITSDFGFISGDKYDEVRKVLND